jgi:hypothetical protein
MDMYRTCAPQEPGVMWARFYDDVTQLNKFQFQVGRWQLNRLHGVISQKMIFFITIAVETSNLTLPYSVGFLRDLLLEPEDEGDIFPRNVGLSPKYTALQPRIP